MEHLKATGQGRRHVEVKRIEGESVTAGLAKSPGPCQFSHFSIHWTAQDIKFFISIYKRRK